MTEKDLSIWEGDGLPDFEDWTVFAVDSLDMTIPEIEGWIEACKKEAWVHEQMSKHKDEHQDYHLAVARYFWRRVNLLTEYRKQTEKNVDDDLVRAEKAKEWEQTLLAAIGDKRNKRDDVARIYAVCIGYSDEMNWLLIHNAIQIRWSVSAIAYIKNRAYKLSPL